jgi:hypothetical protein
VNFYRHCGGALPIYVGTNALTEGCFRVRLDASRMRLVWVAAFCCVMTGKATKTFGIDQATLQAIAKN